MTSSTSNPENVLIASPTICPLISTGQYLIFDLFFSLENIYAAFFPSPQPKSTIFIGPVPIFLEISFMFLFIKSNSILDALSLNS